MSDAPWLKLDPRSKPSKAASEDDARPALRHGWLDVRDSGVYLCATDSFVLAQLPVEAESEVAVAELLPPGEGDIGLIPEALAVLDRSGSGRFRVREDGLCEVDEDPALYPIRRAGGDAGRPPRFRNLFPSKEALDQAPGLTSLGIDPRLLLRLSEAIGSREGPQAGVELRFIGELRSIGVKPLYDTGNRGLIMPIRTEGRS